MVPETARRRAAPASSAAMTCTTLGDFAARSSRSICGGGEDLRPVLQHAAAGDDVPRGHGDGVVDVAVLEIELSLPEVLVGVPAAHVVVDGHARIPLRDLVQRAVATHAVGAVLGDVERVLHADGDRSPARRERRVEIDAHHRVVHLADGGAAVDLEAGEVVAAAEAAHAPARLGGEERRPLAARTIQVLVELQPDEPQRVGRIVRVTNAHAAVDRARRGVERRGDGIVGALLPVVRTGLAAARAVRVRSRPVQPIDAVKRVLGHGADRAPDGGRRGIDDRVRRLDADGCHHARASAHAR